MAPTFPVIEGNYLRDLLDQPHALRRTLACPVPEDLLAVAARLRLPAPPLVVLTGMGSSFHALHPIAIRLTEAGIRPLMIETSELVYFWSGILEQETILIAVSQSGRSAEILRLLELDAGRSTLIAITNSRESPLALAADILSLIDAGVESTVSCKTYVSTLLALSRVGEALCTEQMEARNAAAECLADEVAVYLAGWREHVEEALQNLGNIRHMVLAGRGASLASAGTGGLIIKEAARFPAEGMSAAAFRHGPLEMVSAHMLLLVFEGDSRSAAMNQRLVTDVEELGGRAHLISTHNHPGLFKLPTTSDSLRPVHEILSVQMITLALAAREGREAGAFARASKITSIG